MVDQYCRRWSNIKTMARHDIHDIQTLPADYAYAVRVLGQRCQRAVLICWHFVHVVYSIEFMMDINQERYCDTGVNWTM